MLECVVNVSEGRDRAALDALGAAVEATDLLDVHTCELHNRSVFTMVGERAPRVLARAAVDRLDLRHHAGAHPRFGVVDVVPFVPLGDTPMAEAEAARDRFATWAAEELGVPCFLYGDHRTLPQVRKGAFVELRPDTGPPQPHPSAGAMAVGARPVLVAYNLWLAEPDLARARHLAAELRSRSVRALGLQVGAQVQVSMNLIEPTAVGPLEVWEAVVAEAPIARAELVGLLPRAVLDAIPPSRWSDLGLSPDVTIETRLAAQGHPVP